MAGPTETSGRKTRERDLTAIADAIYAFLRGELDARVELDEDTASDRMRELVEGVNSLGERLAAQEADWAAKLQPLGEASYRTALLETIAETTLDGILVADGEGKALSLNHRFLEMWHIPDEIGATYNDTRLIGYVLEQLEDPDGFVEKVQHLYSHRDEKSRDQLSFKDGRVFDRFSAPLVDKKGTHLGRVWYFRDITQNVELEREREERTRLQAEIIEAQRRALRELSTPLVPISNDIVAMPLIGEVDTERAKLILQKLVEGVSERKARVALLDLTGVSVIDTQVADALVKSALSCRLVGAEVVLTGIQPQMAQTLIGLGVRLGDIVTRASLQAGIAYAMEVEESPRKPSSKLRRAPAPAPSRPLRKS